MEKRTIIAIILSVLVLIGFQFYQQSQMPVRRAPVPDSQKRTADPIREKPESAAPEPAVQETTAPSSAGDTVAAARTVLVKGERYQAVLDNRGGILKSWELEHYQSEKNRAFEMIAPGRDRSYPGTLLFEDEKATQLANGELYEVEIENGNTGDELVPPATVVLRLKRGDLVITKRYHFEKSNYIVGLKVTSEKGGKPLEGRFLLGQDIGPEKEHVLNPAGLKAIYYADGEVERQSPPDDENIKRISDTIRWAGLDMQYFTMVAIPSQPFPEIELQKRPVRAVAHDGSEVARDLLRLTTPVSGSLDYSLYIGPKKQSDLEAVRAADITGVIDYGMFSIIVLPLLASLKWIYQYVHNYGYAIIILTFLLSLLLFPFRLKQMISMKKMQVVQPKVKAIQEKYRKYKKTDPKRADMNREIMALYKEHNVNPLGGCLPLLLQFPLLFAFYSLLAYSIELRHAPFILWIQDLSSKDPNYVLPIVMGITAFISQKMTPMAPGADPMQSRIMNIMPVIFTFMFLNLSAGLNLYFLCSNIFQVTFQKIAERWMSDGKSADRAKPSK